MRSRRRSKTCSAGSSVGSRTERARHDGSALDSRRLPCKDELGIVELLERLPGGDSSGRIESGFVIDLGRARARLRPVESSRQRAVFRETLDLAERMCDELAKRRINRAGLARYRGITRARVTQMLALLELPTEVLAWVRGPDAATSGASERKLRPLIRLGRRDQLAAMRDLCPAFEAWRGARARSG